MKYLPYIAGGAVVGLAARRGRRNRIDEFTGEPLPPRKASRKGGKPRAYWHDRVGTQQPSDTKRAVSLNSAYRKAVQQVTDRHVFTPEAAQRITANLFTSWIPFLRSSMRVCDGKLVLAEGVKPKALYSSKKVECVPSGAAPGVIKPFWSWRQTIASRKSRAKRALRKELQREPTDREIAAFLSRKAS